MSPHLIILKLNQPPLILHNLIAIIDARPEQLGQREPLAGHLEAVVGVHELVVVHAVGRVASHALHRRRAAVQRDDVVDQRLPRRVQRQRLGRVRRVVFVRRRLPRLEVFAGLAAAGRGGGGCCSRGRHGSGGGSSGVGLVCGVLLLRQAVPSDIFGFWLINAQSSQRRVRSLLSGFEPGGVDLLRMQ